MDDFTNKGGLIGFATFRKHRLTRQPQIDPFFDYFIPHINKLWGHYHPMVASAAVSTVVEFASGSHLEFEIEGNAASAHYSDYIRRKSGTPDFHTSSLWPTVQFPNISAFVQVVLAISRFTSELGLPSSRFGVTFQPDIVNGILSFYKEDVAGEPVIYVHLLRAARQKESGLLVVQDLVGEVSRRRSMPFWPRKPWDRYKARYITFHLCDSRYKLSELCVWPK